LYPEPLFDDIAIVLVLASFGVGALLSAAATGLRRLFVSRKLMDASVHTAARARFIDQGISVTRARTGVLVYVSLFERRVEIVADIGIPVDRLGDRWNQVVRSIDAAARDGVDPFLTALQTLGPLLAEAVPRSADDVNELPDDMVQA
jgi:putative membrane protein